MLPALHYADCTMLPALHYAACTALHCTALHCTALHCTALHCTALHCTALLTIGPVLHSAEWQIQFGSFQARTPHRLYSPPALHCTVHTTQSRPPLCSISDSGSCIRPCNPSQYCPIIPGQNNPSNVASPFDEEDIGESQGFFRIVWKVRSLFRISPGVVAELCGELAPLQ
jgi:hypothetical protein